jgi:hypothetical protein
MLSTNSPAPAALAIGNKVLCAFPAPAALTPGNKALTPSEARRIYDNQSDLAIASGDVETFATMSQEDVEWYGHDAGIEAIRAALGFETIRQAEDWYSENH